MITPVESDASRAFRAEVRTWLAANAKLNTGDRHSMFDLTPELLDEAREWQRLKAAHRFACLAWPSEYGGRGASAVQEVIWDQEVARYDTPPEAFSLNTLVGLTLIEHGTKKQKTAMLPPTLSGEFFWAMLFTEAAAGSDLAGVRTTATRDGNGWRIRGEKRWNWGAAYATHGALVARTDWDAPKHGGLTYFMVDMTSPGITVRPIRELTGAAQYNSIQFEDVYVPDSARLGRVNQGWKVAVTQLMHDRVFIGSDRSGVGGPVSSGGFRRLVDLAGATHLGGNRALDDAGIRQQLGALFVRLEGIRLTSERLVQALDQYEVPGPEGSILKVAYTSLMHDMSRLGLSLFGPVGLASNKTIDGHLADWWQMAYMKASGARLGGGSDEIQRNIIADRVLSLPPEPRNDRGIAFSQVPFGRSETT